MAEGCEESFRLGAVSRPGAPDAADEDCLPEKKAIFSFYFLG